jgi:hypothetical protein
METTRAAIMTTARLGSQAPKMSRKANTFDGCTIPEMDDFIFWQPGRYIVCRNHQEAEKDAVDRTSIVVVRASAREGRQDTRRQSRLPPLPEDDQRRALRDRSRQGRRGQTVRRHLRAAHQHRAQPARGHAVLHALWTVEQTFRTAKHLLSTRPIVHKLDETIRGHVFCSFLALVLKKALEDRGARSRRLLARDHRRSRLAERERDRARRQALRSSLRAPSRRQPRPPRDRRRTATDRMASRRR